MGALASTACESLIKASQVRNKQLQGLTREEYDFLTQNLNKNEKK